MFPCTKNRNMGTFGCFPGTKNRNEGTFAKITRADAAGARVPVKTSTGNNFLEKYLRFPRNYHQHWCKNVRVISALQYWHW